MVKTNSDLLELDIPANSTFFELIRLMAAGLGARMNFTYDHIEDLKLGLEEVCAKIIETKAISDIHIKFKVFSDRLQVCFEYLPLTFMEKEKARGLILKAIVDRVVWEVDEERCSICLTKYTTKRVNR